MNKIVCITGASSGLGEAAARKFSANGWDCILIARRLERLEKLKKECESQFKNKVLVIELDVSNSEDVKKKINAISDEWKKIDVLVNNAGLASTLASFDQIKTEDIDKMVDVNIKGLLYVSEEVLPYMINSKKDGKCKGHIINIGSIAGKNDYKNGNVYCMTKHAVISISNCQRIDLLNKGIKVTVVNPGAVHTEFSIVRFNGDSERAKYTYNGYVPLYADDIADQILHCANLPENVCIDEITVTPLAQANVHYFYKDGKDCAQ